jgi:hypothetical protein
MTNIKYVCRFRSVTGEVRDVVVELSAHETADVLRHHREGLAAGAPGGPLERGYAHHRAAKMVPAGFVPLFGEDRRVN